MPNYTVGVAAATAVVGYNLTQNERWARSPVHRRLMGIGLTGSAVIGDTECDVFINEVRVAGLFNSALLTPQVDRDIIPVASLLVPAGAELQVVVTDAPATSILYFMASLDDLR